MGGGAESLAWLGAGDRLVFGGSDVALGAGLVNPSAIDGWYKDGVELRRLNGLHAKVVVVVDSDHTVDGLNGLNGPGSDRRPCP